MKLTEAKLKQLILEQVNSNELKELTDYLKKLKQVVSSFPQFIQGEINVFLHKPGTLIDQPTLRDPPSAFFQAAIDSLEREKRGEPLRKEWEYLVVYRQILVPDEHGLQGDVEVLLTIYRNGRKEFRVLQYDQEENELFDYYKSENISISNFINFITSSTEDIVEYAKEENRLRGRRI